MKMLEKLVCTNSPGFGGGHFGAAAVGEFQCELKDRWRHPSGLTQRHNESRHVADLASL